LQPQWTDFKLHCNIIILLGERDPFVLFFLVLRSSITVRHDNIFVALFIISNIRFEKYFEYFVDSVNIRLHLRRYLVLYNGTRIVKTPGVVRFFFYSADLMHKILCNREPLLCTIYFIRRPRETGTIIINSTIYPLYIIWLYSESSWLYHCSSYVKYKRTPTYNVFENGFAYSIDFAFPLSA